MAPKTAKSRYKLSPEENRRLIASLPHMMGVLRPGKEIKIGESNVQAGAVACMRENFVWCDGHPRKGYEKLAKGGALNLVRYLLTRNNDNELPASEEKALKWVRAYLAKDPPQNPPEYIDTDDNALDQSHEIAERLIEDGGDIISDGPVAKYLASRAIDPDSVSDLVAEYRIEDLQGSIMVVGIFTCEDSLIGIQHLFVDDTGKANLRPDGSKSKITRKRQGEYLGEDGVRFAGAGDTTLIAEGFEDCAATVSAGWKGPAVALLGVAKLPKIRISTPEAIIAVDPGVDEDLIERGVVGLLVRGAKKVRILKCSDKTSDPADWAMKDPKGLMKALKKAKAYELSDDGKMQLSIERAARRVHEKPSRLDNETAKQIDWLKNEGVIMTKTSFKKELANAIDGIEREIAVRSALEEPAIDTSHDNQIPDFQLMQDNNILIYEPWQDSVNLQNTINGLHKVTNGVIDAGGAMKLMFCYWAAATHFHSQFDTFPMLGVHAPGYASGKSQVLKVARRAARYPWMAVDLSPATLYRLAGAGPISVLIDEAYDLKGEEDDEIDHQSFLRKLLKGVYDRDTAQVGRSDTDGMGEIRPKSFGFFIPVAYALSGRLGAHIESRSLSMRMGMASKKLDDLAIHHGALRDIQRQLARAAEDMNAREIGNKYDDDIVQALSRRGVPETRRLDVWRPIIQVCALAGDETIDLSLKVIALTEDGTAPDFVRKVAEAVLDLLDEGAIEDEEWIPSKVLVQLLMKKLDLSSYQHNRTRMIERELSTMTWTANVPKKRVMVKNDKSTAYALNPLLRMLGGYQPDILEYLEDGD